MPAQKPKKPAQAAAKAKPVAKPAVAKKAAAPVAKAKVPAKVPAKPAAKPAAKAVPSKVKATATPANAAKPVKKAVSVPAKKTELTEKKPIAKAAKTAVPAQDNKPAAKKVVTGAKRGPKKKGSIAPPSLEDELAELEDELEAEPVVEAGSETAEKAKPLRMKISKAKERALMKEFGLDETVLTEAEMKQRRDRLKALIKLGKTRGYLTNGEISDHLPDKLVDAETLEVVIATLNDLGVAVYEQTPDAESLIITDNAPTGSTEEEAEEAAEAALSTVDSEFGRTTDPVRMYMREMGTVELLTREGEIEIAKRIEGGLM
ncbi:MAG: RNA polymerase sigma factor region1.1 domain-containing protein, partial [Burkholderiales bacterium]